MHRKLAALALASTLAACGGGAVYVDGDGGGVAFSVNGFLEGRSFGRPARAGETTTVSIQIGQSIEFEASEDATWRFSVNNGPFLVAGNVATDGGLTVTVVPVSGSRVRVTTTLSGTPSLPLTVTLSAIASSDNREIATVQLQLR